jgi:hypothetical protein
MRVIFAETISSFTLPCFIASHPCQEMSCQRSQYCTSINYFALESTTYYNMRDERHLLGHHGGKYKADNYTKEVVLFISHVKAHHTCQKE